MAARKHQDTKRSKELADKLAIWISDGQTLREFCRKHDISKTVIYDWLDDDPELAGRIARARERGFDQIAEETMEIADTFREGAKTKTFGDGRIETQTGDTVERARLQVETRLKLLAKWDPKRYGDKTTLDHGGAMTLIVQTGVPRKGDE